MDAKERKAKIREARASVTKTVSRRSSRVTVTYVKPQRRAKKRKPEYVPVAREPEPETRFAELCPSNVHPWDWRKLFVSDEELWPLLVEAAQEAVEDGELQPYERTVTNG